MRRISLRPAGSDDLGLRQALSERLLPVLVAAMALLALLAVAGALAAASLARHWREGAQASLTIQVPRPGDPSGDAATRLQAVLAVLGATPGLDGARSLDDAEIAGLLRPWLGEDLSGVRAELPGVVAARAGSGLDAQALAARLDAAAPGTALDRHAAWTRGLATLAVGLQACAWAIATLTGAIAAGLVALATRAGLVARKEAIAIVHGLGATDGYIADRFARRVAVLAAWGAAAGALAGVPVLLVVLRLAAPLAGGSQAGAGQPAGPWHAGPWDAGPWDVLGGLPPGLLAAVPALPLLAGAIGYATAQATVRRWLGRLA